MLEAALFPTKVFLSHLIFLLLYSTLCWIRTKMRIRFQCRNTQVPYRNDTGYGLFLLAECGSEWIPLKFICFSVSDMRPQCRCGPGPGNRITFRF
jgi:hypothetical protein